MGNEHLGERGAAFSSRTMADSATVATVAIRRACPARHPSPRKSFVPRIATTASLPCSETTATLTLPGYRRPHPQGLPGKRRSGPCGTYQYSGPRQPWREKISDPLKQKVD